MKIFENDAKFTYENLFDNFKRKIIFYNYNGSCEKYGLNQPIIAVYGHRMEFYRFINIKKSFKIENNKN